MVIVHEDEPGSAGIEDEMTLTVSVHMLLKINIQVYVF